MTLPNILSLGFKLFTLAVSNYLGLANTYFFSSADLLKEEPTILSAFKPDGFFDTPVFFGGVTGYEIFFFF